MDEHDEYRNGVYCTIEKMSSGAAMSFGQIGLVNGRLAGQGLPMHGVETIFVLVVHCMKMEYTHRHTI